MNLKEMLKKAMENMANVKAAVEAGEKAAEDLNEAIKSVEDLQAKIKAADEAEKLIKALGTKKVDDENEDKEEPKAKSLGDNFVKALKSKKVDKQFHVTAPDFEKAATDPELSPSGAAAFATTFDKNVVEAPRTALVIRDLFGAESISGSALTYLVEGAMEGAPAVVAEGAKKPQVHFADPTPKTVSLKKIAAFLKESDEYIEDYPFLASVINGRLVYQVELVEQNTLVADLLATSGIQTDDSSWTAASTATDLADLILQAAMDVQDGSGFAADGIVMHPATWYALRVAKNGNDDYYGGGFFGAQNIPNLWGIPVCVTPAVTAGQVIVGAFKTCGSVVSKGGITVEATNSDVDDFQKNLMTLRAEERLALAVRRPAGFMLIEKGSQS